ncbi:hypothetical protein B0H13DRAFT_1979356, partial [Mycena leptocephala]
RVHFMRRWRWQRQLVWAAVCGMAQLVAHSDGGCRCFCGSQGFGNSGGCKICSGLRGDGEAARNFAAQIFAATAAGSFKTVSMVLEPPCLAEIERGAPRRC